MFQTYQVDNLIYLQSDDLGAGIRHGFSTRKGGVSIGALESLNLRGYIHGDRKENVEENYRRFCAAIGADVEKVVLSQQEHKDHIRVVTAADAGKGLWRERDYREIDGLITNVPGMVLTVFSADCNVILLHDPVGKAVGACHAGWRGTALGIAAKTVAASTYISIGPYVMAALIYFCINYPASKGIEAVERRMRRGDKQ